MSRPPTTIRIKRKATDDPVDVLRVHELNGKRQRRATEFVFTRQPTDATLASHNDLAPAQPRAEGPRRIKPLPRSGGQASLGAAPETGKEVIGVSDKQEGEGATKDVNKLTSQLDLDLDDDTEITALEFAQHRRFHISRTSSPRGLQSQVIGGKVQKRAPTVFVERRPQTPMSIQEKQPVQSGPRPPTVAAATTEEARVSRPQKKPGIASRISTKTNLQATSAQLAPPSPAQSKNVRLPSGLVMPWDVTSEQLARELQAYTLEEIGHNMEKSQLNDGDPQPPPEFSESPRIRKPVSTKFKPKVPALRYHERHPEEAAAAAREAAEREAAAKEAGERAAAAKEAAEKEAAAMETDQAEDDGEFVFDTYVRMPAEEVEMDESQELGYIVLESNTDIDEFYESPSDHSENEDYDEEDENAENHYSADYPDEEVDSDDEYDRNPYRYRTGNASDDEEFDENDYDEMQETDDYSTRYPWLSSNQPSWMRDPDEVKDNEDEDDTDVKSKKEGENVEVENKEGEKVKSEAGDEDEDENMKQDADESMEKPKGLVKAKENGVLAATLRRR